MMPSCARLSRRRSARGFSLIEAAIVLGIIGLIIGGIWVAAAAVSNRNRINDAIALVLMAHEEALPFKKNVTGLTVFAPILALRPLPGHYTLSGNYLTNGQQWFAPNLALSSGKPYISASFIPLSSTPPFFTGSAKTDVCLELSKKLLSVDLGEGGTITWQRPDFVILATFTQGGTKPSLATLSTYCRTTGRIMFDWYL